MISLQEFCQYLDNLLQSKLFVDYCKNGLQVEGGKKIARIATAVSADLSTIQEAAKQGVQALIVHHGMFWNSDSPLVIGAKREKLQLLLKHDISLIGYHLPLDAHQEFGNNWKAAIDMGWANLEPFGLMNGIPIGVKGKLKPTSRDDFKKQLEDYYQHSAHTAFGGKEKVQSVGLISGGAYRSISDAAAQGLDCFVTGNFDEPAWSLAFEEKVNFYALGHTATERIGPKALGEHIKKQFSTDVVFIDTTNPF